MIAIKNPADCCGCTACASVCAHDAITMKPDALGFLYPEVDKDKCTDCGLCEKVCPFLNEGEKHIPLETYAAINKDEKNRLASSSGGIFTLLAMDTIADNGIVFGARFDKDWQVKLDYTDSMEGIAAFRGSKYVQARTENAYILAKKFLIQGRKVLFTGTPCQIAGLKKFLRKEYQNLLTVEIVCHGVPSPKVWEKYLNELPTSNKGSIISISFRDKSLGWKKYSFSLRYSHTEKNVNSESTSLLFSNMHRENIFMRTFLANLTLRPSCHKCRCKEGKSGADITIGDFWGIDQISPEMDDDKGTSLIIIQTEKGKNAYPYDKTITKEQTLEDSIPYNAGLQSTCIPHPNCKKFASKLEKTNNIKELMDKMLSHHNLWTQLKSIFSIK